MTCVVSFFKILSNIDGTVFVLFIPAKTLHTQNRGEVQTELCSSKTLARIAIVSHCHTCVAVSSDDHGQCTGC